MKSVEPSAVPKMKEFPNYGIPPPESTAAVVRMSPTAYAKLLLMKDLGDTEISGFGIAPEDDLLYVSDFATVKQVCTSCSVKLDDTAVAEFIEKQVDLGIQPRQCSRIMIHTHPGSSAEPSSTDEETFSRVFCNSDWGVMVIMSRTGNVYVRFRSNSGPRVDVVGRLVVDYTIPWGPSDFVAWHREYHANVSKPSYPVPACLSAKDSSFFAEDDLFRMPKSSIDDFTAFGDSDDLLPPAALDKDSPGHEPALINFVEDCVADIEIMCDKFSDLVGREISIEEFYDAVGHYHKSARGEI